MTTGAYDRAELISKFAKLLDAREQFDERSRQGKGEKFADEDGRTGAHQIFGDAAYLIGSALGPAIQQAALTDDTSSLRVRLRDFLWQISPMSQGSPSENIALLLEDALAGLDQGYVAPLLERTKNRGARSYPKFKMQRQALWWVQFELGRSVAQGRRSNRTTEEQYIARKFGVDETTLTKWREPCERVFGRQIIEMELRGAVLAGQGLALAVRPDGRTMQLQDRNQILAAINADGEAYRQLIKANRMSDEIRKS